MTSRFLEIWNDEAENKTHMVYTPDGITVIAVANEEDAKFFAEYMTRENATGREYYWKAIR